MARLLKCYGTCNEKYEKEVLVKVGTHNYCPSCAEIIEKERQDREILYKTIQTIYKVPYPTGQMLRQMKQFADDRGYTYEGMTKTLCFFVKVMQKVPSVQGALSFLPYYYDNAISYYIELDRRRKELSDVNTSKKVIKISYHPAKNRRDEVVNKRIIKMGDILNDG